METEHQCIKVMNAVVVVFCLFHLLSPLVQHNHSHHKISLPARAPGNHHLLPSHHRYKRIVGACAIPFARKEELSARFRLRGRVGVHLALAAGHDDVHEAAGVGDTLLRTALGDLLLLLLLDLLYGGLVIVAL